MNKSKLFESVQVLDELLYQEEVLENEFLELYTAKVNGSEFSDITSFFSTLAVMTKTRKELEATREQIDTILRRF